MEEEALLRGEGRIKFKCVNIGDADELIRAFPTELQELHHSCGLLEKLGCAPVQVDGKVAGNGAVRCESHMLVTRSGKSSGEAFAPEDFCFVEKFDETTWTAFFRASGDVRPSSDTPLLWTALFGNHGWSQRPVCALHGHAFATDVAAEKLGAPISREETLFSTPPDKAALESLFQTHSYPSTAMFIRRQHGFFLLSNSVTEACVTIEDICKAHNVADSL